MGHKMWRPLAGWGHPCEVWGGNGCGVGAGAGLSPVGVCEPGLGLTVPSPLPQTPLKKTNALIAQMGVTFVNAVSAGGASAGRPGAPGGA